MSVGLCHFPEALGEKSLFLPFPASGGCLYSVVHDQFLHIQSQQWPVELSPQGHFSGSDSQSSSSPSENPCEDTGPPSIIQDKLLLEGQMTSNLNSIYDLSPVPFTRIYSQVPRMRIPIFWGSHYSDYYNPTKFFFALKNTYLFLHKLITEKYFDQESL